MTIEELRLEKGLTRTTFAERLGIDLSTLDDYESGKRSPSAKELEAIKDIFGAELSTPALIKEAGQEAAEAAADEEATAEAAVEEAVEEATIEEEAIEEAVEETAGGSEPEEVVEEAAADEKATVEDAAFEAEAVDADIREAAELVAAAEKEARKAAKKARKAEKLAARQRADEEATRRVIDIISALGGNVNLDDRDAVAAARDAYDGLTDDQELMIPGDVLRLLFGAEVQIEAAEEAAAKAAAKPASIEECRITVKDVTYTGKKIKKPSVKVVHGETELEPGEDFSVQYDRKAREIGIYTLTVKGKGRFTGCAKAPFYVVPKASGYVRLLGGDKQADKAWKLLKHIEGYQIEYSLNKDLSDSRKAKIRKPKDLAKVLGKLKTGKKYYLRVRLFATVKKKRRYSDWSKVKSVKL